MGKSQVKKINKIDSPLMDKVKKSLKKDKKEKDENQKKMLVSAANFKTSDKTSTNFIVSALNSHSPFKNNKTDISASEDVLDSKQDAAIDKENKKLKPKNLFKKEKKIKEKILVDSIDVDSLELKELSPAANSITPVASKNSKNNSETLTKQKKQSKSEKPQTPKKRKKEIGAWGEQLVFKKLKADNPKAVIEWHNKEGEQGLAYDVSIGDQQHVEVKTTVLSPKSPLKVASFSKRQVQQMIQDRENYTVVRVSGAETKKTQLNTIRDPYGRLFHPKRKKRLDDKEVDIEFKPGFPIVNFKLKI